MIRTVLLAAMASAIPAMALAEPVTLVADPSHTSVRVEWPHNGHTPLLIAFPAFEGAVMYDAENIANSSVTWSVDTTALWTGVPLWEEHLADPERPLLQTATYPTASFASTAVAATGENTGTVTGDLTIRDITIPVTFDVELTNDVVRERDGKRIVGFLATAEIDRTQFGIDQGVADMGETVTITVAAELSPAS